VKRAIVLVMLAACGDNHHGIELDSGFDDHSHTRVFGRVLGLGPAPERMMAPVGGANLCFDADCGLSELDGTFVVAGPSPDHEGTLEISYPSFMTTIIPVVGGAAGDRNLADAFLIAPALLAQTVMGFGADAMIDTRGAVLVEATRYDDGVVQIAIDGTTISYLDNMQLPDPTRTQLAQAGGAVIFAVPPGEAVIHTTAGMCAPDVSGWPGDAPGDIRIPVVAGQFTYVRPICAGR